MKEILARLGSESPVLFKRLQRVFIAVAGIAGSILIADIPESVHIPAPIITACQYITFFATILFGTAKLPVKDPDELKDKLKI